MLEIDGLVGMLLLFLWVYCIFDVISSDGAVVRNLPKTMWLIVVFFLPDIGSIAWLLLGRPERAGWAPGSTAVRPETVARWTSSDEQSLQRSVSERDRLLAQWEREEAERTQSRRELVDRENEVRKRDAELRLIESRQAEREAERVRARRPDPPPEPSGP